MKQKGYVEFTPDFVESLEPEQVFVFGSNLIGYHSGGASLMAMKNFEAIWGQAEGQQGQCYAIPVDIRGEAIDNVSSYMKRHIDKFIAYAKQHQEQFFLVPKIGCGAAGFDEEFMALFFKEALNMENISLPKSFVEILNKNESSKKDDSKQRVFNLIILDESGSMVTIAKQAVSGLNETFQTIRNAQKEHQEQQHFISLVTFNSSKIRTVLNRQPVDCEKEIKWTDYYPNSGTPLYTAMGESITELKEHVNNDDVVLVTIITDGMENASWKYSGSDIKKLVGDLKEKGWVFAYIGTNQDVDAVADDMGIRSRMYYECSPIGARDMFDHERSSKERFFGKLHQCGRSFLMNESYDYFNPDNEDNEAPSSQDDIISSDNEKKLQEVEEKQNSTESYANTDEKESAKGFWGKLKDYLIA